jgi:anti-sigma factor RsiW
MEHAREIELIELTAGRLNAERTKAILAHLESCPACRTRRQDIQRTWDLLGAWQVQSAGHRDVAELAVSSGSREERPVRSIIRFLRIGTAVRVAAAILVAVLAGYGGGRWSVRPAPTGAEMESPAYMSVLGSEIGDSFSSLVLSDEPSSSQES